MNPEDLVTIHFKYKEFMCRCGCGLYNMQKVVIDKTELIRTWLKLPMDISSGSRCPAHNKKEGGKPLSDHLEGMAIDVKTPDLVYARKLVAAACLFEVPTIYVYSAHVHLGWKPKDHPILGVGHYSA